MYTSPNGRDPQMYTTLNVHDPRFASTEVSHQPQHADVRHCAGSEDIGAPVAPSTSAARSENTNEAASHRTLARQRPHCGQRVASHLYIRSGFGVRNIRGDARLGRCRLGNWGLVHVMDTSQQSECGVRWMGCYTIGGAQSVVHKGGEHWRGGVLGVGSFDGNPFNVLASKHLSLCLQRFGARLDPKQRPFWSVLQASCMRSMMASLQGRIQVRAPVPYRYGYIALWRCTSG